MFGSKNLQKSKQFFVYVLSNRKESSNKQSAIEVEVWKWNDSDHVVEAHKDAPRQYLEQFIKMALREEKSFYEYDKQKAPEFWNKSPSCFNQSSDDPRRLIFTANSRGNHVFDIFMDDGNLRTYSNMDILNGKAIGLQERAYVRGIDLIDQNFMSLLLHNKVAKWQHKIKLADFDKDNTLQYT